MRLRQAVLGLLHVAMGRSVEGSTIYLKASSDREGILIEVVRPVNATRKRTPASA